MVSRISHQDHLQRHHFCCCGYRITVWMQWSQTYSKERLSYVKSRSPITTFALFRCALCTLMSPIIQFSEFYYLFQTIYNSLKNDKTALCLVTSVFVFQRDAAYDLIIWQHLEPKQRKKRIPTLKWVIRKIVLQCTTPLIIKFLCI